MDEKYEYQLEPNKGLEIKFSINEQIRNLETEDQDILMEHSKIRFHVLYYLYNKYYGRQTGKHHHVEKIIQETELKNIDRNLINGNIAYIQQCELVTGKRIFGNGGYPPSIIITKNGIDLVENIINKIIVNIGNQQIIRL